jgi:hypothetical protein
VPPTSKLTDLTIRGMLTRAQVHAVVRLRAARSLTYDDGASRDRDTPRLLRSLSQPLLSWTKDEARGGAVRVKFSVFTKDAAFGGGRPAAEVN